MITRAQALVIGESEIRRHGLGIGAREALLRDEIRERFLPSYGCPNLADCWIVYAEPDPRTLSLESSRIVLVSQSTGAVIWVGDAGDEG